MAEEGTSSFVEVVLTLFIGGILLYALYPVIQQLNPTYAPLFVLAVVLMLGAMVYGFARRVTGYA